jgi:hypothetical protein
MDDPSYNSIDYIQRMEDERHAKHIIKYEPLKEMDKSIDLILDTLRRLMPTVHVYGTKLHINISYEKS